jgi:hypothetical protein
MELTFTESKETKGTVVFAEDGDDPKIGTLYIKKAAIEELGFKGNTGRGVRVTVEAK